MATVLSPYITVPKVNKGLQDKICESGKTERTRPVMNYYRSKSARRIQSELLADAYTNIIADRCRSAGTIKRSEHIDENALQEFRSVVTPELREILRAINDTSFMQRSDAFNDVTTVEKKTDEFLKKYEHESRARFSSSVNYSSSNSYVNNATTTTYKSGKIEI